MSRLVEANQVENLEFKWGKKRGVGGKKKEVRFYESFTCDGVDYTLHDCVYLYKEGEPNLYIGKLIKIWENPDKTKKVKVHWFFRPSEIFEWLGNKKVLGNEIFLASGEGVGMANVNPLEAIAGKCNVVCISEDSRNPQPSEKELQMADYIFYRTFDVRNYTISDRMEDKIAGLEVKYVFNRKESEEISSVPKLDYVKKEEAVACNQTLQLLVQNPSEEYKTPGADRNSSHLVAKASADVQDSLVKSEPASGAGLGSKVATTTGHQEAHTGDKTMKYRVVSGKDEIDASKVIVDEGGVENTVKITGESDVLENQLSKKRMIDKSVNLSKNRNMDRIQKLTVHRNDAKASVTTNPCERKEKMGPGKDSLGSDKTVKSAKDTGASEYRPSKKARVDISVELSENKDNNSAQKLNINSFKGDTKDLTATLTSEVKMRSKVMSFGPDKDPKPKSEEEMTKLSNGRLVKVSSRCSPDEDRKTKGDGFEVTRKPEDERSKWFRALPWEERMKNAHELGTLILLSNLDLEYTSGEVEDIIWHAFKEHCTAKMVQRLAISSPHSGQALVILKTKGAAEKIVKELHDGCLMLSNGRPLVGSVAPPLTLSGKQSTFVGHLYFDKPKHQMQREMKEAVSTSHCSQPNTIEYEMAMEWCLLQSRSTNWWRQLYKQQGEELRKLQANLKFK